jgi:hypothetical protein
MPQTFLVPVVPGSLARPQRWHVALLVGLALSVGLLVGAQAATTWTVCASGCDYSSIKAAIAAATTRDGDTVAITAGTYTEAGIAVNKSLTLQGEHAASTIVQAATSPNTAADRVFTIARGVTVTIRELTIRYGVAPSAWPGGGGLGSSGTLTLITSTVSGNDATIGGGLYSYGTVTLTNSTISGNSASGYSATNTNGGGGLFNQGTVTLTNSIVANNLPGGDGQNFDGASIISHGYNLDSEGSCHLTAVTDQPGADPLLGPLQDNGGPTFTQALRPGSPAIDAIPWGMNGCGTTLYSDQRWQARPESAGGACDIGAYEVEGTGQALGGWVTGLTPHSVTCQNITTGHVVTLSASTLPWDCEEAGLGVSSGDQVRLRVQGPVKPGVTDVGGAVAGMTPSGGGCTNRTTGRAVKFQALFQGELGATAAGCVAAGLGVHPGDQVQMQVQGAAE